MQDSQVPARFSIPFGNSAGAGFIRPIPTASQIGIQDGAASLTDGFPPDCFSPVGAGGVPPFGQDANGILNQVSAWCRWVAVGGPTYYDAGFSGSIGGYPKGAILGSASIAGRLYVSTADNNTVNPDVDATNYAQIPPASIAPTFTQLTNGTGAYVPKAGCVRIECRMIGAGGGGGATGGSAGSGAFTTFGGWTALGGGGGQNSGTIPAGGGQTTPGTTGSGAVWERTPGASGNVAQITVVSAPGSVTGPGQPGASSRFGGGGAANGNDGICPGSGGGSSSVGNGQQVTSGAAAEYVEFSWPAPFPASIPYSVAPNGLKGSGQSRGAPGIIIIKELYQ